jgi:hypothetical protein
VIGLLIQLKKTFFGEKLTFNELLPQALDREWGNEKK